MKYLRLVLIISASLLGVVRAQDEERRAPPVEIPDFSNLDEYIYEPKSTVRIGIRHLGGAKTEFSGTGTIKAVEDPGPATGANLEREYHDGYVFADERTTPRLDEQGNPLIDPQTGQQLSDPIAPDGRTNNWSYSDARQVDADHAPNGFIAFHSYSAEVTDLRTRQAEGKSSAGLDLAVSRDMGNLFGTRITWTLMAGMSVNDISGRKTDQVEANLRTITDLYSLYGQNPPTAPYTPGPPTSQTVTNSDGSTQTIVVDTTVLIGNEPAVRQEQTTETDRVTNNWKVKGAYYTFRGGSELWIPITSRFRAGLSLGAALVYSGTNYTVTQTLEPEFGPVNTQTDTSSTYKLLPGYYADASLQFDVTDRAGFFAAAVFQSAGSYTQNLSSETASYSTKVDLSNQSGVRAGMSIRF